MERMTHEEVSAREANSLVVSADDRTVDAVRELVDILRKNTRLQPGSASMRPQPRSTQLTPVVIASYVVFSEQPSG